MSKTQKQSLPGGVYTYANEHMKIYSTPLAMRGMHIKPTIRHVSEWLKKIVMTPNAG